MRFERAAGGVVFLPGREVPSILLVLDRFGRWTFPKGHVEHGESDEEAALREIEEETGVTGQVVDELAAVRYRFLPAGASEEVEKEVRYFLVRATGGDPRPREGETREVRWFRPDEVGGLPQYPNNRPVLEAALEALGGEAGS
ncbi:MAG: NUDIX domain-containing protein [Bacillota bacterium]|nr:NUDIX domain-containing protein [Bacillota bacterium]